MFLNTKGMTIWTIILFHGTTVNSDKHYYDLTATLQKNTFTSPNYPAPYPRPVYVEWTIQASSFISNGVVHMKVQDSNISNTFNCYEDIVEVMDGPSSLYSVIRDWCGDSYPSEEIISSGSSVTVAFSASKRGSNYRGLRIEYWAYSSTKNYLPVRMATLNWGLLLCSGVIYGIFIGGCIFLYVVEKERRKILQAEKESWVTIDDVPEDYLENLEDDEKERRKKLKIVQEREAEMRRKVVELQDFPPIDNYVQRVVHLKDWKSIMVDLDFSKRNSDL